MHLTKLWTKKKFWKEKKEKESKHYLDHSLSLEPNSNKISKESLQNHYLGCFHICLGSSKKMKPTKFHLVTIAILANMQNLSIWHFPFSISKMLSKGFQFTKPWWWLDSTLNQPSNHIKFIKFGVGVVPQLIVLQNVLLMGIIMP